MKEPPLPCETTMSGSLSPLIGQSLTPGTAMLPRSISPGGSEQGDHIAPLRAGPSASAGTSMKRKPAACASVAVRQRTIVTRNLVACIRGSPGCALLQPNGSQSKKGAKHHDRPDERRVLPPPRQTHPE